MILYKNRPNVFVSGFRDCAGKLSDNPQNAFSVKKGGYCSGRARPKGSSDYRIYPCG